MTAISELLREQEAAEVLGKSRFALREWRRRGYGPPVTKIGRTIRYSKAGLTDWLKNQEAVPCPK
jgi:predicted DNA-binding transcriptional regulator AlpA